MVDRNRWRGVAAFAFVALLAAPALGQGAGIVKPAPEYETAPITDPELRGPVPPGIAKGEKDAPGAEGRGPQARFDGDDRARVVGEMRASVGIWRQRAERLAQSDAPAADRLRAAVATAERHLTAATQADGPQWMDARDAFRRAHDDLAAIWDAARKPG